MASKRSVHVKKVSPYPFLAELDAGGKKFQLQVRKLTLIGFIAELPQAFVKVGEEYLSQMQLPVMGVPVSGPVKVIKTYDQFREGQDPSKKVARLAEFHFISLRSESKADIIKFLTAIRQTA